MKKTKKIVSTILGLLSAFSFKSSAMDFDIDDDEDELTYDYDIDGEFDNQKSISSSIKTLISIGGVSLLGLVALLYKSLNKSPKWASIEEYLLEKCAKRYLYEFKNNDELVKLKQDCVLENPNFFLVKCSDKIIKRICNYYTFMSAMQELYNGRDFVYVANNLASNPEYVVFQVVKNCNALEMKKKGDIEDYSYTVAVCVIRSLFDIGTLDISNRKNVVNNENFDGIVDTCFSRIDKFVNDKESEIAKNYEKNNQGPANGELKKFYSWFACCLGADLWKKLYPDKEYDEQEYLRLQKQLCIM